jgi:hypothetical protein
MSIKIDSNNDFLEIVVTPQIIKEAQDRNQYFYRKYGNIGTNRIDKKNQRITGYLAEVAIKHAFNKLNYSDDDGVDFISKSKLITLDSKSQGCNGKPKINYVGTLYENQKNRKFDILIFSRVKNTHDMVWVTGFITKDEFLKKSKLIPKGTKNNNFTYDESRYELEYSSLYKPSLLF